MELVGPFLILQLQQNSRTLYFLVGKIWTPKRWFLHPYKQAQQKRCETPKITSIQVSPTKMQMTTLPRHHTNYWNKGKYDHTKVIQNFKHKFMLIKLGQGQARKILACLRNSWASCLKFLTPTLAFEQTIVWVLVVWDEVMYLGCLVYLVCLAFAFSLFSATLLHAAIFSQTGWPNTPGLP